MAKHNKPDSATKWLKSMKDTKEWLKEGITMKQAASMLENYAAYRVNFEKDKDKIQPPTLNMATGKITYPKNYPKELRPQ